MPDDSNRTAPPRTARALVLAALALLGGAGLLAARQGGIRVPAFTAYTAPDPEAVRIAPDRPVRPWRSGATTLLWVGTVRATGTLEPSVLVRLPAGDTLSLRLTVGTTEREARLTGTGAESRVVFTPVPVADTGSLRVALRTANGRAAPAAEVIALHLDGPAAAGAHFNLEARRNAASVHLRFPIDSAWQATGFYSEVTAVDDPVTTYYMATGIARGYFGMQVNSPTERRIIFSVWDAAEGATADDRSTVAAENHVQLLAKGEGVVATVFGNEGTGGHSHLVYPWKTGSVQRFFVTAAPHGTNTDYSGWWFHPERQEWVLIASFRAPKDGGYLRRLYSFSENFGGATGHLRRKALFGRQWVQLRGGEWKELTTATFSHDPTGRTARLDRFMGIEQGQFFLSHGGFGPGFTASGEAFTRPPSGAPPVVALPAALGAATQGGAPEVPFTVADSAWDSETLGNHRAVVRVATAGRFARAELPWRRRDRNPEAKGVIVVDARTAQPIANVSRGAMTQAVGTVTFEPASGPGRYYIYYLPYKSGGRSNYPNVTYLPVTETADSAWRAALSSSPATAATVERFEAVDSLNAFTPMEIVATPAEVAALQRAHAGEAFLVFPEDRTRSIRMRDQLPVSWAAGGPRSRFSATARRGEFLAFQLGVFAQRELRGLRVAFSDLRGPGGATLPASRLTSINNGGTNWDGRAFTTTVNVPAGAVQAMWCGLDVPETATTGTYTATATVTAAGATPRQVVLTFTVTRDAVAEGGANEPEKLTRLKWLNSTLGQRNEVIAPYTPLRLSGRTISLLGRRITLAPSGLPARIETFFTPEMTGTQATPNPVLAAPIRLDVATRTPAPATPGVLRFTSVTPGQVRWVANTTGDGWALEVRGSLEFDGYLSYQTRLTATRALSLDDVSLVIPYAKSAATYAMGLGLKGQRRPSAFDWTWDVSTKNQDAAWLGAVNAGLQFSLRSDNYVRPLNTNFYLQKPLLLPPSWGNDGRGTIRWHEQGDTVAVRASSGARTLAAGDSLRFDANFLVTPFHAIDPEYQWGHRFYHRYAPLDTVAAAGANTINVHHATAINPYINYPFIAHREMKAYIDSAHQRGLSVKIYNTVRELSNRSPETFALRSLGHEIYSPGKGGGYSWLQEHLGDDYIAAWFVPELKDAAVINSGMSRWHNYYVEGINWLVRHVGIDGLYLDDVAFDRTTMKRVKRMLLQEGRPGIVDLHSANQYNERDGFINSAMLYMELFPYLDRLWFGEYFDYEKNSADFFLTEISGIPFGLMGEMLEGGGNPWRGLLYGMTNRMPWNPKSDPRPVWRLWDDFGIRGSRMLGYWAPSAPVRTGRDDVLATSYVRDGRTLVAIASWAEQPVTVRLAVDWKSLGLDAARAVFEAPAIAGMQDAARYGPADPIAVEPGKGIILVIR